MGDERVDQALRLVQEGKKNEAGQLIREVLNENKTSAPAWVILAGLQSDKERQIQCLERAIAAAKIDSAPDNEHAAEVAQKQLQQLKPSLESVFAQATPALVSQPQPVSSVASQAKAAKPKKKSSPALLIVLLFLCAIVAGIGFLGPIISSSAPFVPSVPVTDEASLRTALEEALGSTTNYNVNRFDEVSYKPQGHIGIKVNIDSAPSDSGTVDNGRRAVLKIMQIIAGSELDYAEAGIAAGALYEYANGSQRVDMAFIVNYKADAVKNTDWVHLSSNAVFNNADLYVPSGPFNRP